MLSKTKTTIKKNLKKRKFYYRLFLWGTAFSAIAIVLAHVAVEKTTKGSVYNSVSEVPSNHVGLVLGTNKYIKDKWLNLYYKYRIEAAVKLFKSGKIKYIIVSGDNHKKGYNEPAQMRDDLVKKGVPEERIFLDYAGFRTLDSVVRSKEIFGQSSITIISQPFHNKRAVFIARSKNIDAVAFNAKSVSTRYGFKVQIRELFARVKLLIDLYVIYKQPKFLGEQVTIPE